MRHPLVWVVIAGSIGFTLVAAANDSASNIRELIESLLRLNYFVPALILPFAAGALAPVFFLREVEHGMEDLFAAYPQNPSEWLRVRLVSFAVLLIALCVVLQVAIAGVLWHELPDSFWRMVAKSAGLFAIVHLPACLIWACMLAGISCRTGKSGFVYLATGIGWLGYVSLATLTGTPLIAGGFVAWEPLRQAMLIVDPYAITALVDAGTDSGSMLPKMLAIPIGRIIWLLLCLWMLSKVSAIPSHSRHQVARLHDSSLVSTRESRRSSPMLGLPIAMHLRWTLTDKVVLIALAGWVVLMFPEVYSGMRYAEQLSMVTPDSRDALNRVMWDMLPLMAGLLLLFTADRLCRMDSALAMSELTAATPFQSWRCLTWQLVCISLLGLGLHVLTLLFVLVAQLASQSTIEPNEYLVQSGQNLPGTLLTGMLFVAVHGAVRSRMAANLVNLGLFVLGFSSLASSIGLRHPLWKPLSFNLAQPDHVLGLSNNWHALSIFSLFWFCLCAATLCLAATVWHRNLPFRQLSARRAVRHPALYGAALLFAAGIWQGAAINRLLTADGLLVTVSERERWRAGYERGYSHWARKAQPETAEVHSFVSFDPAHGRAKLRIVLHLVNRTEDPIDAILVGRNQIETSSSVSIDDAKLLFRDDQRGQSIFRLKHPMLRGETRRLHFSTVLKRSGALPAEGLLVLHDEFASIPAYQIMPVIGFRREFMLRDPGQRRRQGLPQLELKKPTQLSALGHQPVSRSQAILETVVDIGPGYQGVAQGELVRKWQDRGRSYYHFRTERPIRNLPAFFALKADPVRWQVGATTAEVFAPEPVGPNNPNRLAISDTLAWLDDSVAPYPGKTLRLIAIPELGISGFALPQTVLISHRLGFRARPAPGAGFSQVYRRAVHETAHQWFGHLLGFGIEEEHAFLVESLAKYAELVMMERRYGRSAMLELVNYERTRFMQARLAPSDVAVPLIDAEDNEDMYSRASLSFACLRENLGDQAILAALHALSEESLRSGRAASSLDFIRILKAVAGKEKASMIDKLLLGTAPIDVTSEEAACLIRLN